MFDIIMTLATQEAVAAGYTEITPAHLLIALSRLSETDVSTMAPADSTASQQCQGKLTLAEEIRDMLGLAKECVKQVPSAGRPALLTLPHLVCAVTQALPASQVPGGCPLSREQALQLLRRWLEEEARPPSLGGLTRRLRTVLPSREQIAAGHRLPDPLQPSACGRPAPCCTR